MQWKEAEKCEDCNGVGMFSTMEMVERDNPSTMAPVGEEMCDHCKGDGKELDEQVILERLIENLDKEQDEKLQVVFMRLMEVNGIPITKENFEDLYDVWLSDIDLTRVKMFLFPEQFDKKVDEDNMSPAEARAMHEE